MTRIGSVSIRGTRTVSTFHLDSCNKPGNPSPGRFNVRLARRIKKITNSPHPGSLQPSPRSRNGIQLTIELRYLPLLEINVLLVGQGCGVEVQDKKKTVPTPGLSNQAPARATASNSRLNSATSHFSRLIYFSWGRVAVLKSSMYSLKYCFVWAKTKNQRTAKGCFTKSSQRPFCL